MPDYWLIGIPLSEADLHFATPQLRRQYMNAQNAQYELVDEFQTTMDGPNSHENVRIRNMGLRINPSLMNGVRGKMRDLIYAEIADGKLVVTGLERQSEVRVKILPDEFAAGRQREARLGIEFMDWENSVLRLPGRTLINVRIAQARGRPSLERKVNSAFKTLAANDEIEFTAPQKAARDKIGESIVAQKMLPKAPSRETIRKYIVSDFNKIKDSKKP